MQRRPERPQRPATNTARDRGFSYLGLLFLIGLLGLTTAMAGTVWSFVARRDGERELLFIGREYRNALAAWQRAHAGNGPATLEQLLGEKGSAATRRYLRRLYADPMGGGVEWGLVKTPQGGIVGVFSRARGTPIRRFGTYADEKIDFAAARTYADWVFGAPALAKATVGGSPVPAAAGGGNDDEGVPAPPPPTLDD
jgi:type II secretory pathway pseudopilin PulG